MPINLLDEACRASFMINTLEYHIDYQALEILFSILLFFNIKYKRAKMEKKKNFRRKRGNKHGKTNWAQRRKMAKNRQGGDSKDQTGVDMRDIYPQKEMVLDNVKFDLYYRRLLDPLFKSDGATTPEEIVANKDADFEEFRAKLKEKLPITFRVNPSCIGYEAVTDLLSSDTFIKDWAEKNKDNPDMQGKESKEQVLTTEEMENLKFKLFDFYPDKLLYELPLAREVLRKDRILASIHKFVQKSNDSGLLTRQEIVSMIPPLLLDVKPHHKIYDACAAPGSKTAQLLEFGLKELHGKNVTLNPGFVIANDADDSRANMLAHQMSRFNYGCIVNHDAQNFPTLHYQAGTSAFKSLDISNFDNRVYTGVYVSHGFYSSLDSMSESRIHEITMYFDRIVCDVPCSSDAAIRKIPKKWETWDPIDGAALHPLQLKILLRSLLMLKPGSEDSYLTYSTCSLNPIENEAVVYAALKKLNEHGENGEEFEIVDCRDKLTSFKTRPGL